MAFAYNIRNERAQYKAMRRLAPVREEFRTTGKLERSILVEMLQLSEDIDPIEWLQGENAELCARIVLWRELQHAHHRVAGVTRAAQAGWQVPQRTVAGLGPLLNVDLDSLKLHEYEEPLKYHQHLGWSMS